METVWITGASSGIGEACALRWAAEGAKLVLTSHEPEKLEEVAAQCRAAGAPEVLVRPYDFRNPEGLEALAEEAWAAAGRIDILYLNAGISQRTTVEDTPPQMNRLILEVNFFAPTTLARVIAAKMVAAGGGKIAVTTSIAGRFGFPLRCAYSASKHALYGWFETLSAEYYAQGLRVTFICPGRVRTNISVNSLDKGGVPHGVMDPGQAGGITPEKAARIIVRGIRRSRREVPVGSKELIMLPIKRFFPGLAARLSRRIKPM